MSGTIRWNLITGLVGFLGTLLVSMPQNIFKTALIQSCYSFAFLFLFTFVVRWVLGLMLAASSSEGPTLPQATEQELAKGQTIDLATPSEDLLSAADVPAEEELFAPLNPPKLSTKVDQSPEELAQALRHMSEE
jgi:hypothetical protein